jgi:hypothetical protein
LQLQNLRFGGGVSATAFNPIVAVIVILVGLLICCLPRRKAVIPFLLASILIPRDQILVVAGLHFPLLRILIIFGMIRIFIIRGRGKWNVFSGGVNSVDKSLIFLSLTTAVASILLFHNTQIFIYQLGEMYTVFGTYFLLRCLIRDQEDVVRVIRSLAFIVAVLGCVMVVEQLTKGWNPYVLLGGARARDYTADMVRDGKVRAVASFGQTILAGTFGAVVVPLFCGLWMLDKKYRLGACIGIIGALAMAITSNSSTPLFGLLAGILGLCLWPIRSSLRLLRWGLVAMLVSLHLVMKAPVWDLISRVDLSGGSSSYHRYQLINQCIIHFWDWWLVGTSSNGSWGWDMFDTANQYVDTAYRGGLLGLIFLIAIIVYGFKYLGKARRNAKDKKQAIFFWALGSALFAHVISFIGISYWDQSIVGWYALLAFIGAIAVPQIARATEPQILRTSSLRIAEPIGDPVALAGRKELVASQRVRSSPLQRPARERWIP